MLWGCANIGSPEGGPRDFQPPRVISVSPEPGSTNVNTRKITIKFDEIVNLKDQMKKVSVSPVQHDMPVIRALGKKIEIELRDTLKPNATYVIDFANAIEDNNEGNQLDGYAITFSTGNDIDTMQLSGMVLRANDLEPMQHVLVGIHSNLSDTAFTHLPMDRVTRTNSLGQFTIMGIKPGRYHIFALNDVDGNYAMNRSEDYAFLDDIIVPSTKPFTSIDTTFTFDHRVDTIVERNHVEYLPNDILLPMFNERYTPLYVKTTARNEPQLLHVLLSTKPDSLPRIKPIKPVPRQEQWYVLEQDRPDSLFYWITDSSLIQTDSIKAELSFLKPDSDGRNVWTADTVTFAYRKPNWLIQQEKNDAKERREIAKRAEQIRKKIDKGEEPSKEELLELKEADDTARIKPLKITPLKKGEMDIGDTLGFSSPIPVAHIDPRGIHLEILRDSVWKPMDALPIMKPMTEADVKRFFLPVELQPDSSYRLTIDSLAVTSIYGLGCDTLRFDVKVKGTEQYANLMLHVNLPDSSFVQLLDAQENVKKQAIVKSGTAIIPNIPPSTYYARVVVDKNRNGIWDPGNYELHLQPEEVYYYPKQLKLRRNWDNDITWDVFLLPIDKQKPDKIKKNKPEKNKIEQQLEQRDRRNRRNNGQQNEDEEEDEFNSGGFSRSTYSGNKYRDYRNNNSNR